MGYQQGLLAPRLETRKGIGVNHLAKLLILGAVTMCGGTLGYLQQAGFFETWLASSSESGVSDPRQTAETHKPISRLEYWQRTERGWWIGGMAGAVVGVLLVTKLSQHRD